MNIGKMMQQAKKMQEKMQQMQAELAAMELTGEAGGGMVRVVMTGDRMVRKVEIDPLLLEDKDKELMEDLIAAAFNSASQAVEAASKNMQSGMLAGMPIPPGFSL